MSLGAAPAHTSAVVAAGLGAQRKRPPVGGSSNTRWDLAQREEGHRSAAGAMATADTTRGCAAVFSHLHEALYMQGHTSLATSCNCGFPRRSRSVLGRNTDAPPPPKTFCMCVCYVASVVSDSLRSYGL